MLTGNLCYDTLSTPVQNDAIILLALLLTLTIPHVFSSVFTVNFEHVFIF